jgi:hypothetical protein
MARLARCPKLAEADIPVVEWKAGFDRLQTNAMKSCCNALAPRGSLLDHLVGAQQNDSGIVSPMTFAALRLTTNWNFVGCITGKSDGFSPLRIRPE